MDSSLVRKMLKAKVYVEEPDRVTLTRWTAEFRGDNATHTITFEATEPDQSGAPVDESEPIRGIWACNCEYFGHRGTCSHVMAAQDLRPMMVRHHDRTRTPSLIPMGNAG